MKNLIQSIRQHPQRGNIYVALMLRFLLVMLLFTICRLGFYVFNMSYFPGMTPWKFLLIMVGGLRFDVTAILYTNLLYIFLMIVPFKFRFNSMYQAVLRWLFYITNSIALAMNVGDFIYFKFTGRRTTGDIFQQFENEKNMGGLFFRFILDYWYATIVFIGLVGLMVWLYRKIKLTGPLSKTNAAFYISSVVMFPIVVYFVVVGIRGGFVHSTRPITLSDAGQYVYEPADVSIVLNTPFALYRTLGKTKIKRTDYFKSQEALEKVFTPIHHGVDTGSMKKMNVVVIVLESFSKEFIGYYNHDKENGTYKGYTPFLDSLLQHSRSFKYSFANGRKSIDALPSVIASLPSMGIPYVLSPFSGNKINSLANLLGKEGYHSAFFHGAPNGSMGFEAFMNIAGVDAYYGMDEYNNDDDYDGWWGIWDEKFLNFTAETQKDFKEPFLSVFFSVSSHHPFRIPKEYEDKFKGGREPILKCIQYTDNALRKYFNKISKYDWYSNTLFVLSADHTSSNVLFDESRTAKGLFSIPLVFFRPDGSLSQYDTTTIIQQADLMPTALGYINYTKDFLAFGRDVFHDAGPSCAWNYKDDVFQYYEGDYLLQFDGRRSVALYNFKTDTWLKNNLLKDESLKPTRLYMEEKIKAVIQQYNNRMVGNDLLVRK